MASYSKFEEIQFQFTKISGKMLWKIKLPQKQKSLKQITLQQKRLIKILV